MKFSILALTAVLSLPAATVTLGDRTTTTYLYPVGGDFSASYLNYNNRQEVRGAAGDTDIHNWSLRPAGTGHYANGSAEVSAVPDFNLLPGILSVAVQLLSGTSGYYEWGYNLPVGASFADSFITTGVEANRRALFFSGGGTGGTLLGAVFVSTVILDGDWSNPANRSALSFNPSWTITENFVFDNGKTIVSGFTNNYSDNNPQFAFTLYGDRVDNVPEPATALLAGCALAGLAGIRRRRN